MTPSPSPTAPVPDADDDEDDLGPDHDDESSDDDDIWPIVLVSLLGAASCFLFFILAFFWRRFYVPDFMWSTPVFSPGPEPIALGQRIVINSPSVMEKMLLYHVLEETLGGKKRQ